MFINSVVTLELKRTSELIKAVKRTRHTLVGETNFAGRLDTILSEFIQKLKKNPFVKRPRPMSIYVLTNAIWQGADSVGLRDHHREHVARAIVRTVADLEDLRVEDKMLGIQFIRFGDDPCFNTKPPNMGRLAYFDHGMKADYTNMKRDICDTTSAKGNVWKMMLGSINPYWDDDPD